MLYGAYGSNMNLSQMSYRCPRAKVIGVGELKGYKLIFRGSGVANVEKAHHLSKVPIVVWKITKDCLASLDLYEGYPRLYSRVVVPVLMDDGIVHDVIVYVMAERYESMPTLPWDSYFWGIYDGYKANNINVISLLNAVKRTRNEIVQGLRKVR